jgi:hypothetical protein
MMLSCEFYFYFLKFNNNTSIYKKKSTQSTANHMPSISLAFKYKHTIYLEINPKEKKINKGFRGNFMEGRSLDAFPEGPRLEEFWRNYQRMDLGGGRGGGIQCSN